MPGTWKATNVACNTISTKIATFVTETLNVTNIMCGMRSRLANKLLGNRFHSVPSDKPTTRNIPGITTDTWRAVPSCVALDMLSVSHNVRHGGQSRNSLGHHSSVRRLRHTPTSGEANSQVKPDHEWSPTPPFKHCDGGCCSGSCDWAHINT